MGLLRAHRANRETKQVLQPSVAMPVELICWLRYRRSIGLEHGTHGHPLLETALATLDPPPAANEPSELSRLIELGLPHMQAYLADA